MRRNELLSAMSLSGSIKALHNKAALVYITRIEIYTPLRSAHFRNAFFSVLSL